MSWHREDWAKLGARFVDWFIAHPNASLVIAAAILAFTVGALLF